jgi:uncharacterized protein
VIALDTNLLVYAHRADAADHGAALGCLRGLVEGDAPWALPWSVAHEFLFVMTNGRGFRPMPPPLAIEALDRILAAPSCVPLAEGPDHWVQLRGLLADGPAGRGVYDARIAATCIAHGVRELWTTDADFSRFPRLRTRNPLVA